MPITVVVISYYLIYVSQIAGSHYHILITSQT